MRALGAVLVVVGMATAHAHPVRIDGLNDPFARTSPCEVSKVWSKVTSCLARQGYKISVLHETDDAKLVALRGDRATDATLGLYMFQHGAWTRQGFYASTNANTELLAFERSDKAGYRMDIGTTMSTNVQVEEGVPRPAILRRIFTTECRTRGGCRTIFTSCDVLVDGRAFWAFRGRLIWAGNGQVRVAGDTRIAGMLCTPPKSLISPLDDERGDPLE
jgi:hypothetical protein